MNIIVRIEPCDIKEGSSKKPEDVNLFFDVKGLSMQVARSAHRIEYHYYGEIYVMKLKTRYKRVH